MTPATAPKKTSPTDWHPADIVAALRRKEISLRQLALLNGYGHPNSLTKALRTPYPMAEGIIAEAIGVSPTTIWPSRYGTDGKPNRGPSGARPMLPANAKPSRLRQSRNRKKAASA